jgi:hypothetical protein
MNDMPVIQAVQEAANDVKGEQSLAEWIFERAKAFVAGRTLEIAVGEGLVAPVCEGNGIKMEVMRIDLADEDFEERDEGLMGTYDTVIALGVGEQMKNNRHIVSNCTYLLKRGGHLITRLPAQTALFNGLDQGFRRWKRYNLEYINKVLRPDCRMLKTRYFLVNHYQQTPTNQNGRYSERVTLFNESNSNGMLTGLSMLVIGQKR